MDLGISERRASGGVSIWPDLYDFISYLIFASLLDRAYVFDLSEHAESRPMGLQGDDSSRGHCMCWMGHKLLYGETVRWSERHQRRRWVSASILFMLVRIVIENPICRAFAVGLVANLYARLLKGNAFVVMVCCILFGVTLFLIPELHAHQITGILFQLPSGLGSGGLLSYASQQASGSSDSYLAGFQTALKLVSVAIGLTIGLGLSLVITYPIQSRRREAGIFSL